MIPPSSSHSVLNIAIARLNNTFFFSSRINWSVSTNTILKATITSHSIVFFSLLFESPTIDHDYYCIFVKLSHTPNRAHIVWTSLPNVRAPFHTCRIDVTIGVEHFPLKCCHKMHQIHGKRTSYRNTFSDQRTGSDLTIGKLKTYNSDLANRGRRHQMTSLSRMKK